MIRKKLFLQRNHRLSVCCRPVPREAGSSGHRGRRMPLLSGSLSILSRFLYPPHRLSVVAPSYGALNNTRPMRPPCSYPLLAARLVGTVGSRLAPNARALCRCTRAPAQFCAPRGPGLDPGTGVTYMKSVTESSRIGGGFAQPLLEPSGLFAKSCPVKTCKGS